MVENEQNFSSFSLSPCLMIISLIVHFSFPLSCPYSVSVFSHFLLHSVFLCLSYLVHSWHDGKNGSVWNDGGLDAVSRQTGGHLMTLPTTHTEFSTAVLHCTLCSRGLWLTLPDRMGHTRLRWHETCVCEPRPSGKPRRCASVRSSWSPHWSECAPKLASLCYL